VGAGPPVPFGAHDRRRPSAGVRGPHDDRFRRRGETIRAHWCDSYGGKFSAIGYGKRSGNSIEFEFSFSDGPFYNTFTWHPDTAGWTCRLENAGKNGKRVLFAEDSLRRP
jgi:hypothetical protein